jgi:hypothetical protein
LINTCNFFQKKALYYYNDDKKQTTAVSSQQSAVSSQQSAVSSQQSAVSSQQSAVNYTHPLNNRVNYQIVPFYNTISLPHFHGKTPDMSGANLVGISRIHTGFYILTAGKTARKKTEVL